MVRYLFYTIGDLTYQSPLVHDILKHAVRFLCILARDLQSIIEIS